MSVILFAFAILIYIKPSQQEKKNHVLSVDDVESHLMTLKDSFTVTGVVAKVYKDKKVFTMIDTGEVMTCRSTGCAGFYLPVQFSGPNPKEWDEVVITGMLIDSKGPILQAVSCEVLEHISVQ